LAERDDGRSIGHNSIVAVPPSLRRAELSIGRACWPAAWSDMEPRRAHLAATFAPKLGRVLLASLAESWPAWQKAGQLGAGGKRRGGREGLLLFFAAHLSGGFIARVSCLTNAQHSSGRARDELRRQKAPPTLALKVNSSGQSPRGKVQLAGSSLDGKNGKQSGPDDAVFPSGLHLLSPVCVSLSAERAGRECAVGRHLPVDC